MSNKSLAITVGILVAITCVAGRPAAATATTQANTNPTIAIASPTEGEAYIKSNIQIRGTAPSSTLVEVSIVDTDSSKKFIAHQPYGKVSGNVTSDDQGDWVFTPQQILVPGQFSVQASYTSTDNQEVASKTINFVVITTSGASEVLSSLTIWVLIAASVILVLLIISIMALLARHRRRESAEHITESEGLGLDAYGERGQGNDSDTGEGDGSNKKGENRLIKDSSLLLNSPHRRQHQRNQDTKLWAFEEEATKIEDELARTTKRLEQTNAEIISLYRRFGDQRSNVSAKSPNQSGKQHDGDENTDKSVLGTPEAKDKR